MSTEGRIEICNANIWGTVCNTSWGDLNAQVACKQLGLLSAGMQLSNDHKVAGQDPLPIFMSQNDF